MPEPSFLIRRAEPGDAAALAALAARTFFETFAADNRPEDMAAHLASRYGERQQGEQIADPGVVTLVAESGSGLIGYSQVRRGPSPPCITGEAPVEIWRFYVDRPWHGRGLAHRLMAAARQASRELGGRTLWLSVWERNPRAIAFYAKHGFRDVGAVDFWLGSDRQIDRVMAVDLPPEEPARGVPGP
jgi:ribosomal protein S18 acetylase RimI-like enzyme